MKVLEVIDLHKTFRKGIRRKEYKILHGVNFSVERGSITGFLGANGAGKTTTIKCLLQLIFPDKGEIRFFGENNFSSSVREKVGFLPERPYFYEYLTGREFLVFYASLSRRLDKKEVPRRIDELLTRVGLKHAADRALRGYSKGMLQRIGIAQALIHKPEFVILDEPMSGLDPDGRLEVSEIIKEVAKSGTAVFFSSHLLHDMEVLCDKLVIMKAGKIIHEGATQKLLEDMRQGYYLAYDQQGKKVREEFVELEPLQARLDELRRDKKHILELNQIRPTLEEIFVKMAIRDDGQMRSKGNQ